MNWFEDIAPRHLKIFREIWYFKARTLLVVAAIMVGVAALGAMFAGGIVLERDLRSEFEASNPADAILALDAFEKGLVEQAKRIDGVQAVEARREVPAKLKVQPSQYIELVLAAIPDFGAQNISRLKPDPGVSLPPPKGAFVLDRSVRTLFDPPVGTRVNVRTLDGKTRVLTFAGFVNDMGPAPSQTFLVAYGYMAPETLSMLDEPQVFNRMYLRVSPAHRNLRDIEETVRRVTRDLQAGGHRVQSAIIPPPDTPVFQDNLGGVLFVLRALGVLTLVLSALLVSNLMSAVMGQQIPQIGILKSLGARFGQTMRLYLEWVLVMGGLALLFAVPLSVFGAYMLAQQAAQSIDFDIVSFGLPWEALGLMVFGALFVPALAALVPVWNGARLTILQALSPALMVSPRYMFLRVDMPRLLSLALRNLFRRPVRVVLTLVALALAGAMLIAVLGIRQGLFQAVAESSAISQYNVELNLDRPTSARQLVHTALDVPGVSAAEAWGLVDAYRVYPDGRRGGSFVLAGLPAETEFSKPYVTAGERLRAGDAQGIFLTQDMRTLYPDLQVGSKFVVHVGNKDVEWRVVGFDGRQYAPLAFVDYADWERATGLYGYANRVVVKTERDDPMLENQVEQELLRAFTKQGLRVVSSFTLTQLNRISQSQLDILIGLLLAMAVLIALVGGLGLASMMSLSVMERTREIGILRALGARRGVLRRLVLGEGVLLALGSYVLAVPLSMPLMLVIGNTLGVIILKRPLPYNFSLAGAVVWLGLVVVIALVACWFPAQNVARLTIRETLAYAG